VRRLVAAEVSAGGGNGRVCPWNHVDEVDAEDEEEEEEDEAEEAEEDDEGEANGEGRRPVMSVSVGNQMGSAACDILISTMATTHPRPPQTIVTKKSPKTFPSTRAVNAYNRAQRWPSLPPCLQEQHIARGLCRYRVREREPAP